MGGVIPRETLERLRDFNSPDVPVVSLYLDLRPGMRELRSIRARMKNLLRPLLEQCEGHSAARSVRKDLAGMMDRESEIAQDLGHGVALFACQAHGLFEYLSLPRSVWDTARADLRPYLRPLLAVMDEFHRHAAVVVDPRRAEVFEFSMGRLEALGEVVEEELRKTNYGGWYGLEEHRVRRHAEEAAHHHYRKTVNHLVRLLREHPYELLFVGGRRERVTEFLGFLTPGLEARLGGTFTVDMHTMTPAVVRRECALLEERWERAEEERLVTEVLEAWRADGGAVVGVGASLVAAQRGAVDLLVVDDGYARPGRRCGSCGRLELSGGRCPVCGGELGETQDVIEDLVEAVLDTGGRVEHVLSATPLGAYGVAARLRFPLG